MLLVGFSPLPGGVSAEPVGIALVKLQNTAAGIFSAGQRLCLREWGRLFRLLLLGGSFGGRAGFGFCLPGFFVAFFMAFLRLPGWPLVCTVPFGCFFGRFGLREQVLAQVWPAWPCARAVVWKILLGAANSGVSPASASNQSSEALLDTESRRASVPAGGWCGEGGVGWICIDNSRSFAVGLFSACRVRGGDCLVRDIVR